MAWRQISEEEAKQHPLYGVGGWLLVFIILLILGIALNVYSLLASGGSVDVGDMHIEADMGFRSILIVIGIVLNAIVVIFAFTKNPNFPTVALAALWLGVAVSVVGMFIAPTITITGGSEQMNQMIIDQVNASYKSGGIIGVVVAVILAGLISWYLTASKRVNVTYSHRVKG
ncbi:MAG: hypothetical protein H6842_01565 [Rhodospirillaceae bacterium]|nr:hypothetical protein [Rhodospirillaceae bacterium]